GKDQRLQASARGRLGPDGVWRGRVLELSALHPLLRMASSDGGVPAQSSDSGAPLRSLAPFALQVGGGRASVRDGRFRFPGARLVVRQFDWNDSFVTLKADASGIATRWLAALLDSPELDARPPGAPDLLLGAAINFQGNLADATVADWRGTVQVQRESGDLWVSGADGQAPISAGLRTLGASASLYGRVASLIVNVAGDSVGRIALDARTTLQSRGAPVWARSSLSHSPLAGRLDVAMNSFRWIAPIQGDRWRVDGALDAQLKLAGTLTRPHADGIITGNNLSAHEPTLGMHLRNGVLAAEFAGDRVDVRMLRFEGGEGGGNVAISGLLQTPAAGSSEARVVVDGLAIPLNSGQRIVLSGSTTAVLAGRTLEIIGRLAADEGVIVLDGKRRQVRDDSRDGRDGGRDRPDGPASIAASGPASSDPASSDPAIRKIGITAPANGPSPAALRLFTVDTDVGVDLGRNFRVSGAGVQAGLSGTIRLRGRSPEVPRASGAVDLVDGSYRVDGRALRISRGHIVYDGDLADPAVDLVAVGDSSRSAPGSADDRSLAAVGPPLSAGLLAVCEQSLRGIWNILKLQYEITDRLSLSVRAGSERALDLLWFFPFD
ncbi:MAG: translocation/assembly module TamB domain-containing protein, partial [Lautropia sp.]